MKIEDLVIRSEPYDEDLVSIDNLLRSSRFFRDDEIAVAMELLLERLQKGPSCGYEFVFADYKNRALAYSCYGLIPCTLYSYDLYWIATHNDFRNMGIGKYILNLTEKEIKKAGGHSIYIETSSKEIYLPTRIFYEKNQYLPKARLDNFYDEGDDKIIYLKSLI